MGFNLVLGIVASPRSWS